MIDPNLDALIAADPEALSWALLLAYGSGYDAANGGSLVEIADDRIAALMRATAAAWRARRRPARQITAAELAMLPGCEPWPEETI